MDDFNVWNYYKKVISTSDMKKSECRLCYNVLSHTSTIHNLKSHLLNKHSDEIPAIESHVKIKRPQSNKSDDDKTIITKSFIWEYFSKLDEEDGVAMCNLCHKEFSWKSSIANLKNHLFRKHIEEIEVAEERDVVETADSPKSIHTDPEARFLNCSDFDEPKPPRGNSSKLWNYFLRENTIDKQARCLTCSVTLSYRSTTHNLKHHLEKKHPEVYNEFCQLLSTITTAVSPVPSGSIREDSDFDEPKRPRGNSSKLWNYFLRENTIDKQARCLTCSVTLSYRSTTHNLKHHLEKKHPDVFNEFCQLLSSITTAVSPVPSGSIHEDSDHEERKTPRKNTSVIWNYFHKENTDDKIAKCLSCGLNFSYRSTINNLKMHLKHKHLHVFKDLCRSLSAMTTSTAVSATSSHTTLGDLGHSTPAYSRMSNDCNKQAYVTVLVTSSN